MIAKFSTAEDLLAHYATIRAKLGTPSIGPVVNQKAMEPKKKKEPVVVVKKEPVPLANLPVVALKPEEIRIGFEEVVSLVCIRTGYHRREIFAERRVKHLCFSRQLLWALARKFCFHLSLPQIGKLSGGKDHTTILHGCKKGIKHPEYEKLCMELEALYDEKHRVNDLLIQQFEMAKEGV